MKSKKSCNRAISAPDCKKVPNSKETYSIGHPLHLRFRIGLFGITPSKGKTAVSISCKACKDAEDPNHKCKMVPARIARGNKLIAKLHNKTALNEGGFGI